MKQQKFHWFDASFFVDIIQLVIGMIAVVALALDSTGFLELPWIQNHLTELTFLAICTLIVTSVLERRVTFKSANNKVETALHEVKSQLDILTNSLSGIVSADLLLKDRTSYTQPFELHIKDAKEVCIIGKSLTGLIAHYKSFLFTQAARGCKFRIILNDPDVFDLSKPSAKKLALDITQTLERFIDIQNRPSIKQNIEIRLTSKILSFSLLMIDAKTKSGEIQIELYTHSPSSERPHFRLSPLRDPKWYSFFRSQFETLWDRAKPYEVINSGFKTTNK